MNNLAGNKECDKEIADELTRAGIEIVSVPLDNTEVPYTIIGKLGHYTFRRAWYYWIVSGDTPMDLAKKIYAHPEGKATVRAGGHCGCEPPESQSSLPLGKDVMELITEKDMEECTRDFPQMWEKIKHKYRLATTEEENSKVVNCYHIDSQAGLLLFSIMVKDYFKFKE